MMAGAGNAPFAGDGPDRAGLGQFVDGAFGPHGADPGLLREYPDVLCRLPDRSLRGELRFLAKDHGVAVCL